MVSEQFGANPSILNYNYYRFIPSVFQSDIRELIIYLPNRRSNPNKQSLTIRRSLILWWRS